MAGFGHSRRITEACEAFPTVSRPEPRVIFAERHEVAVPVEDVMTTVGNPVLIVIETIHERLDHDSEDVTRLDPSASETASNL